MDFVGTVKAIFTRHTEAGRTREALTDTLADLKLESDLVRTQMDDAMDRLQDFATRMQKSKIRRSARKSVVQARKKCAK